MRTDTTTATAAAADTSTDRIERSIHIKAARSKVWLALTTAEDYGKWFGAQLSGSTFKPGQHVKGPITIQGFEHVLFDVVIERVEPESLMSYRWHPHAIKKDVDYSKEERTLVIFTLKDAADGTLLTVVESGFDKVPPERRMEAFRGNGGGWTQQLGNIARYAQA